MTRGKAGDPSWAPALLTVVGGSAGKVAGREASGQVSAPPRPHKLLNRVLPLRPLSALPDDRLVEMTRAGSEGAFETLTRRYRRQLLIYAERLLGADTRAEDALQQAFLHAWLALRGGAEVAEARPWLYRIVHNCAVSNLRRARHECVALSEQLDAAATDTGPEPRLVLGEIFDHLALMPERQREALVMTAIAGRSHEEAATALGLTDGAVRGLVYRARSALRRAAAAILPSGLWHWAGRRHFLGPDAADAAGAVGSAGVAAAMVKGGALVATAGVIAGAGHGLLASPPAHHPHRAIHHSITAPAPGAIGYRHSGPLPPATVAASEVTLAEQHGGASNHDRHSRRAGEGGGRGRGSGSSGRGDGGGRNGHPGSGSGGDSSGSGGDSSVGGGSRPDSTGSPGGDGDIGGHGSPRAPAVSESPAALSQPTTSSTGTDGAGSSDGGGTSGGSDGGQSSGGGPSSEG